jgi:hypothetical protein
MYRVRIQHAQDTGLYHPAWYALAPFPGGITKPLRFKSKGHHTQGFTDLTEAEVNARKLADELSASREFDVIELDSAGPHIFLAES